MKAKITQNVKEIAALKIAVLAFLLSSSNIIVSQTVTDVFPTRVTTQSIITIIGSGFTTTTRNNIALGGIGITAKTLVSSTEMTFEVSATSGSDILNKTLTITGATIISSVDTSFDYIAPSTRTLSNTRPYFVEEIYTNWDQNGDGNHFWRSNDWTSITSTWPNTKHELLGFKMYDGPIFSTGILSEADFKSKLPANETDDPGEFYDTRYKAYSTNGVQGRTGSNHYILAGDLIDGVTGNAEDATNNNLSSLTEIAGVTIFDVIVDGLNGLELGTGISNFNNDTSVRFFSGNGQPGTFGDAFPDLLITQIAQPGGTDIYFYADERGNVVGKPIKLEIPESSSTRLAEWQLDLYSFPSNQPFVSTNPNKRGFTNNDNEHRPIRMIAFKLEDFGINDTMGDVGYIGDVNNINMMAGGTADMAFLAYNAASFDIKSPLADPLLSKFVCKIDGTSNVTFSVNAGVDDGSGGLTSPAPGEELSYEWLKYNLPYNAPSNTFPSISVNNVVNSDLATYKVKVSNTNGTVILPVTLSEGGTPTFWNGSAWQSPFGSVVDEERGLVFSTSYNQAGDLKACDCTVTSGNNVTLPIGSKMILYDELTVQPAIPAGPENSYVPPGTFTLENNASLVQIKAVSTNENTGKITMKRVASNLHTNDYVYWSSPVDNFSISNIPGNLTYQWETNATNANGTSGNWEPASGIMMAGEGYIKRVPSAALFTANFSGKPRNGLISIPVDLTATPTVDPNDNDWNLIGNPYPSAINAVKFLNLPENNSIEGAVYLWTHENAISSTQNPTNSPFYENFAYNYGDEYLTHNETGSNPSAPEDVFFAGNIAAGQAFFVKALANGNVTFKNELRYNSSEDAYNNNEFFRANEINSPAENSEKQLLWLSLVNDNAVAVTTLIGYAEGATYDKDRMFDALTNGGTFSIYSLIANDQMIIQGRPLPFVESDIVPLGIKMGQNGIYTLALDNLKGSIFEDPQQPIYIEDLYLNVVHDLRLSPYTFIGESGSTNDRFMLRYTTDDTLAVNEEISSNTFVFINTSELQVRSSQSIESIQVYDLNGKLLIDQKNKSHNAEWHMPFPYARGVYFATIQLENGILLKKKLMNSW